MYCFTCDFISTLSDNEIRHKIDSRYTSSNIDYSKLKKMAQFIVDRNEGKIAKENDVIDQLRESNENDFSLMLRAIELTAGNTNDNKIYYPYLVSNVLLEHFKIGSIVN